MVFFSESKVVFEQLSKMERIYYIGMKSLRMSLISSVLVMPIFVAANNKSRLTSKHADFEY